MKLISISPPDDSVGVALESKIILTFDDIVDQSLINDSIYIRKIVTSEPYANVGPIMPITTAEIISYSYSINNSNGYSIITITPDEIFESGIEYKVIVTSTLNAESGTNLIDRAYSSTFKTSERGVTAPPSSVSTVIGQIPDINDFYSGGSTSGASTGLNVISTDPETKTFGYNEIDEVKIKFNEAITTALTYSIQVLDLETLSITTLVDAVDYTITILSDTIVCTFIQPIVGNNKKVYINLQNVVSAIDSTKTLDSYHYEIVTMFDPFYSDSWMALSMLAAMSGEERYYIAHIIYYASRETEILSGRCDDSPMMTYYRQKWTMAKAVHDLMAYNASTASGAFVTDVTLGHLTVKRELSEKTGGNALDTALEEMKRYELPLLTCGVAVPDGVLPPKSAMIFGNTTWVKMAGRSLSTGVSELYQNAESGGSADIYTRVYTEGGGLLR